LRESILAADTKNSMNRQQRDQYIQMREEEVYGRREPTLQTASRPALSRSSDEIIGRTDPYERAQANDLGN
jgi:hypothetical protein